MKNKPINYSSALERIGGDRELLEELLEIYVQEFFEKFGQLRIAVEQKNYDQILEVGHSLKGSSANLSLIPLQEASSMMEMSGREKNIENAEKALPLLEQEFKRLQDFLAAKENPVPEESKRKSVEKIRKEALQGQVLAVDDSTDNQLLLKALARQTRISLDTANNGREAIELFRKKKYSLIFLDINMPGMNGFEAFKEIRRMEKNEEGSPSTPVIALTGSSFLKDRKKCLSMGFTDYVQKPFERNRILEIFRKYVKITPSSPSLAIEKIDESIRDLIPDYIKNRKMDLNQMRDALRENDFASIEAISHKIKGSGGAYGFMELSKISEQIEKYAQKNNREKIKHMLEKFESYLDSIHQELS